MHPIIASFDGLRALRDYEVQHPKDIGAVFCRFCAAHFYRSHAQLFQDLLAVFFHKGKRGGFFVEFGACDGLYLSNTLVLERDFAWRGILAEPARYWHDDLRRNRRAVIDTRAVWRESGRQVEFVETAARELSTMVAVASNDAHGELRGKPGGATYTVETVSINDLLAAHKAPQQIDFLSIDTEGSEREVIDALDFDRYQIGVLTVEHNYREDERKRVFDTVTARGFTRIFEPLSQFDDWFVHRSLLNP